MISGLKQLYGRWQVLASRVKAGILVGLALMALLPLYPLYNAARPISINETIGAAEIRFSTNRDRVLLPGGCVTVSWQVENIQAVYINGRGTIGSGEQASCSPTMQPALTVQFRDGTQQDFVLPITHLYREPLVMGLLLLAALLLAGAALMAFGEPGLTVLLVLIVFGPLLRIQANTASNFIDHQMFARIAADTGDFNVLPPHFLFHILLLGINSVTGISFEVAAWMVTLIAQAVSGLSLYAILRIVSQHRPETVGQQLAYGLLAFALLLISPIDVLFAAPPNTLGRTALLFANTYHSPTMILLRPFALVLFALLARNLTRQLLPLPLLIRAVSMALLLILGTLAKPSFTLAIAPAIALVLAVSFVNHARVNRLLLIGGIILPAVVVLGWQYLFLYGPDAQSTIYREQAQITLAPLGLYDAWGVAPQAILPAFLLSVLFPISVYVLYYRQAIQDILFNIGWLAFFAAWAVMLLFVEIPGQANGNLTWGSQITLLILFAVATGFWLRQGWHADTQKNPTASVALVAGWWCAAAASTGGHPVAAISTVDQPLSAPSVKPLTICR